MKQQQSKKVRRFIIVYTMNPNSYNDRSLYSTTIHASSPERALDIVSTSTRILKFIAELFDSRTRPVFKRVSKVKNPRWIIEGESDPF